MFRALPWNTRARSTSVCIYNSPVAEDVIQVHPSTSSPNARIIGVGHHTQFYAALGIKPMASCTLGSTNWASPCYAI